MSERREYNPGRPAAPRTRFPVPVPAASSLQQQSCPHSPTRVKVRVRRKSHPWCVEQQNGGLQLALSKTSEQATRARLPVRAPSHGATRRKTGSPVPGHHPANISSNIFRWGRKKEKKKERKHSLLGEIQRLFFSLSCFFRGAGAETAALVSEPWS